MSYAEALAAETKVYFFQLNVISNYSQPNILLELQKCVLDHQAQRIHSFSIMWDTKCSGSVFCIENINNHIGNPLQQLWTP